MGSRDTGAQDTAVLRLGMAEAESLAAWLRREPELRGQVTVKQGTPAPDRMGALAHTLMIALGGGSAPLLARSLSLWIKQRRSDLTIEVTIGDHSTRIEASHLQPENAGQLIKEALTRIPPPDTEGSSGGTTAD